MKDRESNLEEILKGLLSVISNDRIVLFQTPQGRTNNVIVSVGGSQRSHELEDGITRYKLEKDPSRESGYNDDIFRV